MSKQAAIWGCLLAVLLSPFIAVTARQEAPIRILFMHHSTGENLIWQGGVREAFADLGYEFWDHGYNADGLTDLHGERTGINWEVPDDNTDPDGWYAIFNQPVTDPPENTFSHMLLYDVILFKSCFPASYIYDDSVFDAYQDYYLSIREVMDQHPDKVFIPFTPPPLAADATDPESAARAQRWARYLTSDEYLEGHPNVFVFDFFSLLADEHGYLRQEYRPEDPTDSHPNELANQTIAPILVQFVDQAIRAYLLNGEAPPPVVEAPLVASEMLEDFEGGDFDQVWWSYADEGTAEFRCGVTYAGYESDYALKMVFELAPRLNGGCGRGELTEAAWETADGVRFYWRSEPPGLSLRLLLNMGEAVYEAYPPPTTQAEWTEVTLLWEDFAWADWSEPSTNGLVPAQVDSLDFTVGDWDTDQVGTVWIDSLQLVTED